MGFLSRRGLKGRLRLQIAVISFLSVVGIAQSLAMIRHELNRRAGPGVGPVLARLKSKTHSVQRKLATHYWWSNVELGDGFYHRESLETGPASRAVLAIDTSEQKETLEIEENSLVVFDGSAESIFRVLFGSIIVHNSAHEVLVHAKPNGAEVATELTATLTAPASETELFTKKGASRLVAFAWSTAPTLGKAGSAATLQLQVSSTPNDTEFASALPPLSTPAAPTGPTSMKLKAGEYLWRLSNGTNPISRTGQFKITEVLPVELSSLSLTADGSIHAVWQKTSPCGKHVLEIASTADFSDVVASSNITPSDGMDDLTASMSAGQYFGRIRSICGDLELTGQTASFSVSKALAQNSQTTAAAKGTNAAADAASRDANASRDPASTSGATAASGESANASGNSSEASNLPAAIASHNADPTVISLTYSLQGSSLLLNWMLGSNATPDFWQLWCVGSDGTPLSQIQTTIPSTVNIPGTWSTATVSTSAIASCSYMMIQSMDDTIESNIVQVSALTTPPPPPQITAAYVKLNWKFLCLPSALTTEPVPDVIPNPAPGGWGCPSPIGTTPVIRANHAGNVPSMSAGDPIPTGAMLNDTLSFNSSIPTPPNLNDYVVPSSSIGFSNGQAVYESAEDFVSVFWTSNAIVQNFNITIFQGSQQVLTYGVSSNTMNAQLYPFLPGSDPNIRIEVTSLSGSGPSALASAPAVYWVCLNNNQSLSAFASAVKAVNPSPSASPTPFPTNNLGSLYAGPSNPLDVNGDGFVDFTDVLNFARLQGTCTYPTGPATTPISN